MRALFISALGALVALPLAASAQDKWDMPTPYTDTTFHTGNIRSFADDVKKATGGQLEITVHSNNSLIKHPDILRAVQKGQAQIGEILLSQFGNEDPMFEVDSIPFLATGFDGAWKLYQAHKPYVDKRMQSRSVRVLFSVPWPGQGLFSKEPIKAITDLKGVKFRTYSPMTARMAELAGAIPTTVQASEVPQAFATNIVTAMVTSSATGVASKAWEYCKVYYDTNAWHPRNAVIVNERAFQRLPEKVRAEVLTAAAAAEKRGWDLARQNQAESVKALSNNGMSNVPPSPELVKGFSEIGTTMLGEWTKKAGADGEALVQAYRK